MNTLKLFLLFVVIIGLAISGNAYAVEIITGGNTADDGTGNRFVDVYNEGKVALVLETFIHTGEAVSGQEYIFTPLDTFIVYQNVDPGSGAEAGRNVV